MRLNIAGIFLVIAISYGFSCYEAKVGRETCSPGLAADLKHIFVDVMGNVVVLVVLLSNYAGIKLDKAAAIVISVFIVWSGGRIIFDAIKVLLDVSLGHDTLNEARKLIISHPLVQNVQSLTGRNSGRYKFIEANIAIATNDLHQAHNLADSIEKEIQEIIQNVDRISIHYEPVIREYCIYALPVEDGKGENLNSHFGEAPYFYFVTTKEMRIVKHEIIENPFAASERGRGILTAEWVIKYPVDVVLIRKEFTGKGPLYVFSDAGVKVIRTDGKTIIKALALQGISI